MGVKVEFDGRFTEVNQELTLRAYGSPNRQKEECLPNKLIENTINEFLKEGQRSYPVTRPCDLYETTGNQQVSESPLASILIIQPVHVDIGGKTWTRGRYEIKKVYDKK